MDVQTQNNKQHEKQKLETLGLLAGGVAHDFNNLLTSVLGQTSLALLLLSPDDSARKHLEKALQAAEVAAGLSQQLLNYAGRRSNEVELINLNDLIADDVNLYSLLFVQAGTVRLDLAPHLPFVHIRPIHVQQILMNLVINAGEAMDKESGVVTIRTGLGEWLMPSASESESCVYVQVCDTGCGMSAEVETHIFDPFFTTKSKGHGLGLLTIKEIVSNYDGKISVESTVGVGTTFTICFPIR